MTIIRFPNSVGIRNNGGRTDNSFHETKGPRLIASVSRNRDVVDISTEAKRRFEKDNLVRLEKTRLHKEAAEYCRVLAENGDISKADMRNIFRPEKVAEARGRLDSGFYDRWEKYILRKTLEKPGV